MYGGPPSRSITLATWSLLSGCLAATNEADAITYMEAYLLPGAPRADLHIAADKERMMIRHPNHGA